MFPQSKMKGPGSRPGTKAFLIHKMGSYGGAIEHRKFKRPFNSKKAVHIVFRSHLLSGNRSLLRSNRHLWTATLLKAKAKKYQAKLYNWSISSNHIHILVRFNSEKNQSCFLRDFGGTVALKIKKVFQISQSLKVWDGRPFTTLVRHFPRIQKYITQNKNEALGFWPYKARPTSYLLKVICKITGLHLTPIINFNQPCIGTNSG